MTYLTRRNDRYYFVRRVPDELKTLDPRKVVRISLKTDSKREAVKKSVGVNDGLEKYWRDLSARKAPYTGDTFKDAVRITSEYGFDYKSIEAVSQLAIEELMARVMTLKDAPIDAKEAVLGTVKEPEITLESGIEKFWEYSKSKTLHKSDYTYRKWKNPRLAAIKTFIDVVGDKIFRELTRDDALKLQEHWIRRIKDENVSPETANKSFSYVKGYIRVMSDNEKLAIDYLSMFNGLSLSNRFRKKRPPFTTKQIINLLESEKLNNLNAEAKWALFAIAETGARPSEITGLLPQDIRLSDKIPHISITDRQEKPLKNAQSQRIIPLTGYALAAFKAMPNGFPHYRDSDHFTNTVNKFLRENKLMPTARHTVYSLRHSFQDRLVGAEVPERIQAGLMGHKTSRYPYGEGGELKHKTKWMRKICLQPQTWYPNGCKFKKDLDHLAIGE